MFGDLPIEVNLIVCLFVGLLVCLCFLVDIKFPYVRDTMLSVRESKRVFALSSQTEWRLQVSKPLRDYKASTLNRASVELQSEGSGGSEAQKLLWH